MKPVKTFKVPRGIAGGTKKLDQKVADLQAVGWEIKDIKQPSTLNPNFYIVAEWPGPGEPPKLKRRGIHPAFRVLIFFGLLFVIVWALTGTCDNQTDEAFEQAAYEDMAFILEDPDIDGLRVDGSLVYIEFSKPQPKEEYLKVARGFAVRFSKFTQERTGTSHVTAFVTYQGTVMAQADAAQGRVTESK